MKDATKPVSTLMPAAPVLAGPVFSRPLSRTPVRKDAALREEDVPIVESVQRGLHNRGYRRGRFMIDRAGSGMSEHAVHDFQCKVLTALGHPVAPSPTS